MIFHGTQLIIIIIMRYYGEIQELSTAFRNDALDDLAQHIFNLDAELLSCPVISEVHFPLFR